MTRLTRFVVCTLLLAQTAAGQLAQQAGRLTGTGAGGPAALGSSLAISADGNTAVAGGPDDDAHAGAAWVLTRSAGTWSQQGAKLVGAGAAGAAYQGYSVAISADGDTVIVGGYSDASGVGAAWVFTRSGGTWSQQGGKLVGTGAAGTALQGASVAISADGNTAIVGGPGDADVGAAWVFTRSGDAWTQQGGKLVGTGAAQVSWTSVAQGTAVAISGDGNTAIVGGPGDAENRGASWVFARSGDAWTQLGAKLVGSGESVLQGRSVAISANGGTAIVGSDDPYGSGESWVFTRFGNVWSQQGGPLVGAGAVGTAYQGFSVAISADGDTAVVGGEGDSAAAGAAWVFARSGGVWSQQGDKVVGAGAAGAARQGSSVAVSADGTTVALGGPGDSAGAGAAWVFVSSAPRLAFVQQPTTAAANQPIVPAVTVRLEDAGGSPIAQGGAIITMSLSSGTGILQGTTSRATDASGLAVFASLSVGLAGAKQLTATSPGRTAAVSSPFAIEGGSQTAQSFVLSDESGGLIRALAAAGYGGFGLAEVLAAVRETADPSLAAVVTDGFLAALAACPASSEIFAMRLGDVPAGGSVAISTDCSARLVDVRGASYYNGTGTATLETAIAGVGAALVTHTSDGHTPLLSGKTGDTTYRTLGIAWALKRAPLRRVIPRYYEHD